MSLFTTIFSIIFSILVIPYVTLNVMLLIFLMDDNCWELLPELFNPIIIYKGHKVNYFGCFMLMICYHAIFAPFALGYWIYKLGKLFVWLCTIGRETK